MRQQVIRRGVAVVEFAVVSPILFLMIVGSIEFGRMSMVQQTITTAAREGARQAIVEGSAQSEVTTQTEKAALLAC